MSSLSTFLLTTGRTLAQMALYSPEHPSVKGSVQESHRLLSEILVQERELIISSDEGKLIVNGRAPEQVPEAAQRPFLQLLTAHSLHSLSFSQGVTPHEMVTFFRLAAGGELKKAGVNPVNFFSMNNVVHVKLNEARYAKISDEQEVARKEDLGINEGLGKENFDDLSLSELLKKLIEKALPNPTDRAHVFKKAVDLVKEQIDKAVEKVVVDFNREKLRITSERERTEEVVGGMAEGVVVVDEAGKVLMMNPTAEQIYGVKLGERLGKPLWEGLQEEQMVSLAKDLSTVTDRPVVKEVQLLGSQDARKTLRASTAAIQDINGRVVGMVSVLSDVTKQKELNRLQNEFMANVTHDLRAPIHALKLAVAAILEGAAGPTTGEQQKMLSMATRNVDRLSRLIDDLLDFSKIESGAMEVRPQIIELEPLLGEAVASMDTWSKSRGVVIRYQATGDLPPAFADGDRVLQIVNNLISNAIKFTPSGGFITLRAKPIEDEGKTMILVEVEDTGKGISKEDQKRVFDRFVQLENKEKLDIRGTGLGLSICRALVQLHKGRMMIQSPPPGSPHGSVFAFTLPSVQRSSLPHASVATPAESTTKPTQKVSLWRRIFSRKQTLNFLAVLFIATSASARPYWGTVRRVLDSNTIQLSDGTKVRFLGISGPEKFGSFYTEAVSSIRSWLENKEIRLQYGLQERDYQGTWIAYVYVDGVFVNKELVKQGLALVSPLPNDEKVLPDLIQAEREAHGKKRGQWRDTSLEIYPLRIQKKSTPLESPAN